MLHSLGNLGSDAHVFIRHYLSLPDKALITGSTCSSSSKQQPPYLVLATSSTTTSSSAKKLSLKQLRALCTQAPCGKGEDTVVDETVRKTKHVADLSKVKVVWPSASSDSGGCQPQESAEVLAKIQSQLLTSTTIVGCELHSILLYEQGDFFALHKDSKKKPNHELTMTVVLDVDDSRAKSSDRNCGGGGGGGGGCVRFPNVESNNTAHCGGGSSARWEGNKAGDFAAWFASEPHSVDAIRGNFVRVCATYNILTAPSSTAAAPTLKQQGDETAKKMLMMKTLIQNSVRDALQRNKEIASLEQKRQQQEHDAAQQAKHKGSNNNKAKRVSGGTSALPLLPAMRFQARPAHMTPKTKVAILLSHQYSCDGQDVVPREYVRGRDRLVVELLEEAVSEMMMMMMKTNDENKTNHQQQQAKKKINLQQKFVQIQPVGIVVEQPRFDTDMMSSVLYSVGFPGWPGQKENKPFPGEAAAREAILRSVSSSRSSQTAAGTQQQQQEQQQTDNKTKELLLDKQLATYKQQIVLRLQNEYRDRASGCSSSNDRDNSELSDLLFDAGRTTIVAADINTTDHSQKNRTSEAERVAAGYVTEFHFELDDVRPVEARLLKDIHFVNAESCFVRAAGLHAEGESSNLWGNAGTFSMFWYRSAAAVVDISAMMEKISTAANDNDGDDDDTHQLAAEGKPAGTQKTKMAPVRRGRS